MPPFGQWEGRLLLNCWCGQWKLFSESSCTFESNSWIIHHQCLLSANPVFAKLEERAMNTLHSLHTLHTLHTLYTLGTLHTLRTLHCKNFQIRTQQPHHQEHHWLKMNKCVSVERKKLMHGQDTLVIHVFWFAYDFQHFGLRSKF